jgi:hypothetical protein
MRGVRLLAVVFLILGWVLLAIGVVGVVAYVHVAVVGPLVGTAVPALPIDAVYVGVMLATFFAWGVLSTLVKVEGRLTTLHDRAEVLVALLEDTTVSLVRRGGVTAPVARRRRPAPNPGRLTGYVTRHACQCGS